MGSSEDQSSHIPRPHKPHHHHVQDPLTKDVQTKSLLCDVCVDVVTDVDQWITSDHTIDEIVHVVEGLCDALGMIDASLKDLCISLIESNLPDIINGLVNDNLNPTQVCQSIGACSARSPMRRLLKQY